MAKTMTCRERFHSIATFQPFDRLPILEWAPWWKKTLDRWRGEGLPDSVVRRPDFWRHFGLDGYRQEVFRPAKPTCPRPPYHGAGILKTMEQYEALREHFYPRPAGGEARWTATLDAEQGPEVVQWFTIQGAFMFPRSILGIEHHLLAFYEQPELMRRILEDMTEWALLVVEEYCPVARPEFMTFAEDLSYNGGPMISEDVFDEFLLPFYRRLIPRIKAHGVIPFIDSDGDIARPMDWFKRAGIEGILPLERQAGVDVPSLRERHPRFLFVGHYDKMRMNKGEAALRGEFERLIPVAGRGGFLIACDHQTPPGVSYQEYQLYLSLFREYADEAGCLSRCAQSIR